MATIPHNRASYQHVNNLRLGKPKPTALNTQERLTIEQINKHLTNARIATNATQADVCITSAYRLLRSLAKSRISS